MARGIDMPTINRKAGNTTSTKVMVLASALACFNQEGIPVTDIRSFTNTIRKMVSPRKMSMERILFLFMGLSY